MLPVACGVGLILNAFQSFDVGSDCFNLVFCPLVYNSISFSALPDGLGNLVSIKARSLSFKPISDFEDSWRRYSWRRLGNENLKGYLD